MKQIKLRFESGDILIEAILALTITIIIITGIVMALISSLNNSSFAQSQNQASDYAQEGLDVARNLKETDYGTFTLFNGYYCLPKDQITVKSTDRVIDPDACGNIEGKFNRILYFSSTGEDYRIDPPIPSCSAAIPAPPPGEEIDSVFVASVVSWTDSKCTTGEKCHKVELDSCFVNLNQILQP